MFNEIRLNNVRNIFILEDNSFRVAWFKKTFLNYNLTIIDNAQEANKLLSEKKYDLIFLDHDLDDRVFVNSDEENTGYQVAKELGNPDREHLNRETPAIIHSLNPAGAGRMIEAHPFNVCHIPFFTLQNSIKV